MAGNESEGLFTSQTNSKKRKGATDHNDNADVIFCSSTSEARKTKQGKKVKINTHGTNVAKEKPVAKRDGNQKEEDCGVMQSANQKSGKEIEDERRKTASGIIVE
ncbi:unnamed protein product [Thelazia callipaeda]|uniref:Ovule protein n=1 Tax=Thelazia callipaeda TaxID=103827 RepID=A0A0N5CZP9_THECL|nr:unnamed protein product [Thelazia callipaeda]